MRFRKLVPRVWVRPGPTRFLTLDFPPGSVKVQLWRPVVLDVSIWPFFKKQFRFREGSTLVTLQLGDNQFTTAHLGSADKAGLGAGVLFNQPPTWIVDDSTIASITPAADGLSCLIGAVKGAPKLGTAKVTATDVDNPTIPVLEIQVTILAGQVDHLTVSFDAPQDYPADQPTPAPAPNPNAS